MRIHLGERNTTHIDAKIRTMRNTLERICKNNKYTNEEIDKIDNF